MARLASRQLIGKWEILIEFGIALEEVSPLVLVFKLCGGLCFAAPLFASKRVPESVSGECRQ